MTDDRIAEIRARLDAATRGMPEWYEDAISDTLTRSSMAWVYAEGGGRPVAAVPEQQDRDLIAHAPADIAWLLEQVNELTKRVRMYEVVKS
jgi:hypothetical protein